MRSSFVVERRGGSTRGDGGCVRERWKSGKGKKKEKEAARAIFTGYETVKSLFLKKIPGKGYKWR